MIWDVRAIYEYETVHVAYEDAPTSEAAVEQATRRGLATEAAAAPNTGYHGLTAAEPVYYGYDSNDEICGFDRTLDGATRVGARSRGLLALAVAYLAQHEDINLVEISIGDMDGPSDQVGTVYQPGEVSPVDRGFIFEIDAAVLVPRELRSTEWVERTIEGRLVTTTPVAAWFIRDAQRPADRPEQTVRERIMQSPVREEKREGYVLPVMSLEESQAARTAGLDLGPATKTADEPTSRTRFELLELNTGRRSNPPRMARAQRVVAKLEKQPSSPTFPRGSVVTNPEDLIEGLVDYIGTNAHEYFLMIFVNVRNQVIGFSEFTSGDVAGVQVSTSGIFRAALAAGAAALITVHQHPSGDATPSQDDRLLWDRIRAAGDLIGIPCLDNLVLGERSYFSEASSDTAPIPNRVLREAQLQAAERKP